MGAQLKIIKRIQCDLLLPQYFAGRAQHEIRMRSEEGLNDMLILLRQDAACRIYQTTGFFQQPAGGGEDRGLLAGKFLDAAG